MSEKQKQPVPTYRVYYRASDNGNEQIISYGLTAQEAKKTKDKASESDKYDLKNGCLCSGIDPDPKTTALKAGGKPSKKEKKAAESELEII